MDGTLESSVNWGAVSRAKEVNAMPRTGGKFTSKKCAICTRDAGEWAQHPNQSLRLGICASCAAENYEIDPSLLDQYGTAGIHYSGAKIGHHIATADGVE